MNQEHPQIPIAHYLRQLHHAMEICLAHPGNLHELLTRQAKTSRPWALLLEAYENHGKNTEWFETWCRNCQPLL